MEHICAIILAAGKGTRMKSATAKVLHPLLNKPLLEYVLTAARLAGAAEQLVVVGHEGEAVREKVESQPWGAACRFVRQEPQLGTGHALQLALPAVAKACDGLLVLCGDTPLLCADTLRAFMESFSKSGAAAAVLTASLPNPQGYGRILRDGAGALSGIVEEKEATAAQRAICEVNSGIYCFKHAPLRAALAALSNDNAKGEYYLTDTIAALKAGGHEVIALGPAPAEEVLGVNDRLQLAVAGKLLQNRINSAWMLKGVTIIDPAATYIDADVEIGPDTVLEPQTYLRGASRVGHACHIGVGTEISNSRLGDGVRTQHAIIVDSDIGDECNIGPFTYIRPGSILSARVKAGHFVELKKAQVGEDSKIPHLSYVGDAVLGNGVNIGCGSITCNYDGQHKHTTIIGDGAFIGSNTNFVAPVEIGARSITGAGSTITEDVPEEALAIARARQTNIEGWAARKKRE